MKCKTMDEADALCQRLEPLAEEFVKAANVVPDSSSNDIEGDDSSDDADGDSERNPAINIPACFL